MKLNFKEHLTDFAIDKAKDFIVDAITKEDEVEEAAITFEQNASAIEGWDPYTEPANITTSAVVEAKVVSKELLNRVEGKNLFSLPSVLTIAFFLLSTIYVDVDQALDDGNIEPREYFKVFYLLFGGVVTLVARGSEGKSGCYTPGNLPGLKKKDFIDENKDGIDDRHQ